MQLSECIYVTQPLFLMLEIGHKLIFYTCDLQIFGENI